MCRIDDTDAAEVSSVTYPVAKKPHKCGECGRQIGVGEPYERCFMVFEGSGDTFKMCAHCRVGAAWLTKNCGGYLYYEVCAELEEHAAEYPEVREPLRALVAGMRTQWRLSPDASLMPLPSQAPPIHVSE